jgi:hypothetical protein
MRINLKSEDGIVSKVSSKNTRRLLVTVACVACALVMVFVQGIGASASSTSTAGEDPFASYVAPTGALLSNEKIHQIALARAQADGEPNPTNMAMANGQLRIAQEVMSPQATPPSSETPGQAALLDSSVDLVTMTGHFTLGDAPVPKGDSAPNGSVMELLIDAHTGMVEGRYVGPNILGDLSRLGTVTQLA